MTAAHSSAAAAGRRATSTASFLQRRRLSRRKLLRWVLVVTIAGALFSWTQQHQQQRYFSFVVNARQAIANLVDLPFRAPPTLQPPADVPVGGTRVPTAWVDSDIPRLECTLPVSLKSSCRAQNLCYAGGRFVLESDDPDVRDQFNGRAFLVEPMHRQPLSKAKLSGWVYDYTNRIIVQVLTKQKAAGTLQKPRRWIDEQGHWLMDEAAPAFRLMRRWGRLDYNSRIWTLTPNEFGGPAGVSDAWSSVVHHPLSSLSEEAKNAEAAGEMLCFRNMMWGAQIGAFAARYDYYDHFAWRDWAIKHMEINVRRPTKPKLLFTSRPCPGSRCIVNEPQVITMLRESFGEILDVEVVNFAGMQLRSQIELLQSATILMGASGTGMHNGLWMRNGTVLIDILTDTVSKRQIYTEYFVNAHLCGANSPSVFLCLPFSAKPVSELSREELENHEDTTMVRNLPIEVDLVKMSLQIYNHALIYGLNEELINEMMSKHIFDASA
ncbi:hypothetical protein HDU86_007721 [Geranomyces michiganensis]|nr:hypothetical protein HDU86_007721 [Geranomyces michiganensis]